jgi:hypothetical protein
MKIIGKLIPGFVLACLTGPALAGAVVAVSEPGTLTLLGLGAVVVAVTVIRGQRK